MDFGIKDRLALVTGSSRGIGRAIALELAREGARVILVARSSDALEEVRRQMPSSESHHCVDVDLMAEGGVSLLAEKINELGDLEIMIHNLGGSTGVFNPFASADEWKKVWQFNVGIGHELNRLFIPPMIERRWGRIVHISTLAAMMQQGNAPYVAAKCALNAYVKTISREIAKHNVVLSAVAPGIIHIEGRHFAKLQQEDPKALEEYFDHHVPIRRLGKPEEVASAVAFLCSEQASFMAGAIVGVDGGGT
jgi:3-oxoacyl-[acyl-carrier protein] reductase